MKKKIRLPASVAIIYVLLTILAFIFVYPFLWMLSASFKTQDEFFADGLSLIPKHLSFDNFIRAWNLWLP